MAFEKGTMIEVDITGTIAEGTSIGPKAGDRATTKVRQVDGRAVHYLYLGSTPGVTVTTDVVRAKFTARVVGEYAAGALSTTRVQEIKDGNTGCSHFLYLKSSAITVLEPATATNVSRQAANKKEGKEVARYTKGDRIRVDITGTAIGSKLGDLSATTQISEKEDGYTHYLYLNSSTVIRNSSLSDEVRAKFKAEIVGEIEGKRDITTQVREIGADGEANGFTHYVFLDSGSITPLNVPEKPAEPLKKNSTTLVRGRKIRVDMTARVTRSADDGDAVGKRFKVADRTAQQWTHFLDLEDATSKRITGTRKADGEIRAVFDAVVTGTYQAGRFTTTEVRELSSDGLFFGATHYLFTDSDSITALDEIVLLSSIKEPVVKPAEPLEKNAETCVVGRKIRVDITGRIGGEGLSIGTCAQVNETSTSQFTHFMYVNSPLVIRGDKMIGAKFDAVIIGPYKEDTYSTTKVREINPDGTFGNIHYLFLFSPTITLLDETITSPEITPAPAAKKERTKTVEIDGYTSTIDRDEVVARIEEIDENQGFKVIRVRNGEVLETFDDEDEARQYIEDEEYDKTRVVVEEDELDEDDAEEKRKLQKLLDDVAVDSNWTIYNESYFDADWAQEEARDVLGRSADFDSWPLDRIDWDDAAIEQRDGRFEYEYTFDGTSFYGDE